MAGRRMGVALASAVTFLALAMACLVVGALASAVVGPSGGRGLFGFGRGQAPAPEQLGARKVETEELAGIVGHSLNRTDVGMRARR